MALKCISAYKAGKGEDAVVYQPGDLIDTTPQREEALLKDSPGSFERVADADAPVYVAPTAPAADLVFKADPDGPMSPPEAPVKKGKRK